MAYNANDDDKQPITTDELDAAYVTNPTVKKTLFGQVRRWNSLETFEKIFLVFSLVTLLFVIIFTTASLVFNIEALVANNEHINDDTVLSIAILINIVFSGYYVFSGILREKRFDTVVLILSLAFLLLYCIGEFALNFIQIKSDPAKLSVRTVRLVFVCLGCLVMVPLAVKVIHNFGFLIFNVVGADAKLQKLYNRQQFFNSLLVVDFQLASTTLILVLVQSSQTFVNQGEMISLVVGAPIAVVLAVIGYLAARKEQRLLMSVFEIIGIAVFGYIGFKFYVLHRHSKLANCKHYFTPVPSNSSSTTATSSTTITSSWCYPEKLYYATIVDLMLYTFIHLLVLVLGIVVYRGFDQGLKQKLNEKDRNFTDDIVRA